MEEKQNGFDEMKTIEATIYVIPTPKGRARSRMANGRVMTYTPAKTRKAEESIFQALGLAYVSPEKRE